jgi:hypothetical protein
MRWPPWVATTGSSRTPWSRAIDGGEYQPLAEYLSGPSALTFVQGDVSAVAKALKDFARSNPLLVIKGGLADGSLLSSSDLAALADLPPRDVLLARIAGALAAPMQQMAGLLQALPRNLAYGLSALIEQREAGGEKLPEAEHSRGRAPAEAEAGRRRQSRCSRRRSRATDRRTSRPTPAAAEAEGGGRTHGRRPKRPRGRAEAPAELPNTRRRPTTHRVADEDRYRPTETDQTRPKERKEGHSDGRDPDEGPDPRWDRRILGDPAERAAEGF